MLANAAMMSSSRLTSTLTYRTSIVHCVAHPGSTGGTVRFIIRDRLIVLLSFSIISKHMIMNETTIKRTFMMCTIKCYQGKVYAALFALLYNRGSFDFLYSTSVNWC